MESTTKKTANSLGKNINGTVFYPLPEEVQRYNNRPSYEQVVQQNSELLHTNEVLLQTNGELTGQLLFKDQHIAALGQTVKSHQDLLTTQHTQAMSLSAMNTALMLTNKKLAEDIAQQTQIVRQQKNRHQSLQNSLDEKTDTANQLEISGYLTSQVYEERLSLQQELITLTEDECRHDKHVLRQQGKKIHDLTRQMAIQDATLNAQAQQLLAEQQRTAALQVEITQLKAQARSVLETPNSVKKEKLPAKNAPSTVAKVEHSDVIHKEKTHRHRHRHHSAKKAAAPPVVTNSLSLESQAPNNKSSLPKEAALTQIIKANKQASSRINGPR